MLSNSQEVIRKNRLVTIALKTGAQMQFVAGANEGVTVFCNDFEKFLTGTPQSVFRYDFGIVNAQNSKVVYIKFVDIEAIFHDETEKVVLATFKELGEQPSPDSPGGPREGNPINNGPR